MNFFLFADLTAFAKSLVPAFRREEIPTTLLAFFGPILPRMTAPEFVGQGSFNGDDFAVVATIGLQPDLAAVSVLRSHDPLPCWLARLPSDSSSG